MPKVKQGLDALKAAKEAYRAKFTPGFYHSSAKPDIEAFDPNAKPNEWIASTQTKPRGAIFVGRNPTFTESLIGKEVNPQNKIQDFKTGATTYPVSVNLGKHFDYLTPEGLKIIEEYKKLNPKAKLSEFLERGSWDAIEQPEFLDFLRKKGFDTFSTQEVGLRNVGVFDPKNIRGKFAEYNPEHAESADFMKAEGGKINPIKSPREMLFELANMPHMADGRKVVQAGSEMKKLIDAAIKKYTQVYGKPPPPQDVEALKAHAEAISQKSTIWSDPVTQARARHQLATDPNLINPDTARDQFLTQAMTGRTVKGTYLEPKPLDINDPQVQKAIEAEQAAGTIDVPQTTTPGSSALAEMATSLENRALSEGKVPLIDKLKLQFFAKNKRYPTEEELDALIAGYNPLRHQYGSIGESIVQSRPPTAKGMQQWKEKARTEGIGESYLEKPPADYRKPLQDQLAIGRGQQPTTPVTPDDAILNPNREYADGRSVAPLSPRDMEAMLATHGKTPTRLAGESYAEKLARRASIPFAGMSAHAAGQQLAEGEYGDAALHGASAVGSGMAATRRYMKPGLGVVGAASVPMSIEEALRRYQAGDRTGAVISAIEAAGNAASMFPPLAIPGAAVGLGAGLTNAFRGERSVMEGYK